MKEFTIKVNGVEQSINSTEKLADSLNKVNGKIKAIPISAEDIAKVCKSDFQEVAEYIILYTSKIEAILTELSTHVGKMIEKNVEAGEKMAESIDKSVESGASSAEKAIAETSSFGEF